MGFGTDIMSKLQELTGSIGSDGSILPGKESTVNYLVGFIKAQGDVDISVVDVENPETGDIEKKIKMAEYVNPDTGEIVPETIYNSYTEVYDGITAAGEFKTSSEYFGDGDIYVGCLSTTGGEKLARALTFASGANLKYTPPSTSAPNVHVLTSQCFSIYITESSGNAPATIRLACPSVKTDGDEVPISPFNEVYATAQGLKYINYYIRKGSSGDCYLKGEYSSVPYDTSSTTPEEDFANITMNVFISYNPVTGVLSMENNGGGFALVAMEDKVDRPEIIVGGVSVDWQQGYSENQDYAFVLWRYNGSPFLIGYPYTNSKWNADYASQCWNRILTNSEEQIVALAPIFNPGSRQTASKYSFWSMIISQEGSYLLSVGNGGTYFYDHGFALRND